MSVEDSPTILPYLWKTFSTSILLTWKVLRLPTKILELTACGSCELVWFPTLHRFMVAAVF